LGAEQQQQVLGAPAIINHLLPGATALAECMHARDRINNSAKSAIENILLTDGSLSIFTALADFC
jgi:hypothetical protein